MAEYIEREVAEKRLFQRAEIANSAYIDQTPYQIMRLAQNVVHLIPAADVAPVVRCKECRHRDPEDHKCDSGMTERQGCPFPVRDNYFCAYGER